MQTTGQDMWLQLEAQIAAQASVLLAVLEVTGHKEQVATVLRFRSKAYLSALISGGAPDQLTHCVAKQLYTWIQRITGSTAL